ncbi:MAG: hypothetical protein ACI4WS_04765 [Oscillospiraceae bacterium]
MSKAAAFFMAVSAFLLGFIIGSRLEGGGNLFCGNTIDRSVKVRGGTAHNT